MPSTSFSRRTFLAGTAAAAGAAFVQCQMISPTAAAAQKKKLGIALVGIGTLSTGQLYPALTGLNFADGTPTTFPATKDCQLVAMVTGHRDRNMPAALRAGIKPEHVYTYENFDTIKNNPEVDIIYIVLPNSMHCEYTLRAAKAGKHVLCEKPMANNVEDCQKMIAACKAANRKLMIAYRMHYEPLTINLMELARDKDKVGKITHIEALCSADRRNDNYKDVWRIQKPLSGGGALMDMGIYALQSVRYLSGQEPVELITTKYDPPDGGTTGPYQTVERNIVFDLKFASGMTATVTSSYTIRANRTQVTAEKGDLDLNPLMNYTGNKAFYTRKGGQQEEVPYEWKQHFACEMDDFSQCVMQNKKTRTPGEEGLRDMKIIVAAYESAKTGKAVKLVI